SRGERRLGVTLNERPVPQDDPVEFPSEDSVRGGPGCAPVPGRYPKGAWYPEPSVGALQAPGPAGGARSRSPAFVDQEVADDQRGAGTMEEYDLGNEMTGKGGLVDVVVPAAIWSCSEEAVEDEVFPPAVEPRWGEEF